MMLKNIVMGTLLAAFLVPATVAARDNDAKSERRFAKKFKEVTQVIQYDGDYAPSATREPEPEPAVGVPVRFVPAWKRDIPVRVKPAPRYVDPAPAKGFERQQGQAPTQSFQQLPENNILTSANGTSGPSDDAAGYVPGAGSATGSSTYANYGTGLPGMGETQNTANSAAVSAAQ